MKKTIIAITAMLGLAACNQQPVAYQAAQPVITQPVMAQPVVVAQPAYYGHPGMSLATGIAVGAVGHAMFSRPRTVIVHHYGGYGGYRRSFRR